MLIEITTQSATPLMLDRFHEGLLLGRPKTTNHGEEPSPRDQCREKLYLDDAGATILPADNLLSCIVDAGRFIKVGKRQLSTRDTTLVTGFLSIVEAFIPLRSREPWRVDSRGIVNQATKGRHICYRPIFDDWSLKFTLDLDTGECQEKTARELIDRAGRNIGLGVMRPSRKGRYGQFVVQHWAAKKVELRVA